MAHLTLVRPDGNAPRDTMDLEVHDEPMNAGVAFELPKRDPRPQAPPRPRQEAPRYSRPAHPMVPPPRPDELNDFANPNKIDESPEEQVNSEIQDESPQNYDDMYDNDDDNYDDMYDNNDNEPPEIRPLPPFETIEDERADLMYKLQRASRSGIRVRNFGWNADIREMRAECARAKAEQEVDASIAFQRQILMTICTGLEYANKKFAYLDLELDGWSESLMDDIGKFDTVFEKLHKKHAGRLSIPPELQLILMIGGSAMTWHLVASSRKRDEKKQQRKRQTRSRKRQLPSDSDTSASTASSESESERERQRQYYSKPKRQKQQKPGARDMRGPGFDVGGMLPGGFGLMSGLGGMLPPVPVPNLAPPQHTRGKIEELSEPSKEEPKRQGDDGSEGDGSEGDGSEGEPYSEGSERLSDIPSEDLDEIPSDMSDPDEPKATVAATKLIDIAEPKKTRGRKKQDKNIIVI